MDYYQYAKETLQLLSTRDDIIMFLFTSSHPNEVEFYQKNFKKDNINFKYINCNPEVSEDNGAFGYYKTKPYYNVLFEDKAGFNLNKEEEWKWLHQYIEYYAPKPDLSWKK